MDNVTNLENVFYDFRETLALDDKLAIYCFAKVLIEMLNNEIKNCESYLDTLEVNNYFVENCSKYLKVYTENKASIDSKVIDELTDEEIRKVFKVTEKSLKDLGKKDLIEKYKTIKESKTYKVENVNSKSFNQLIENEQA